MLKDKAFIFSTYLIYFYPLSLILGPAINNFYQIIICLVGIYILIIKKLILAKDQKSLIFLLCLLFFYSIIITFYNNNFFFIKNTTIFLKLILFVIVLNYLILKNYFNLKKFIFISSGIILIVIFDTYFQFFNGKNLIGFEIEPNNLVRLTSFFQGEYVVGGFIARTYLPFLIFTTFLIKDKNIRFYYFLFFSIIINISIFITGERSSVLISFINFCFLFILLEDLKKIILYKFLISILCVFVILFTSNSLKNRYVKGTLQDTLKIFNNNDNNIYNSQYGAIYLTSLEIMKDNIFFGQGLRTYRLKSCNPEFNNKIKNNIKQKTNHSNVNCSTHPHNFILELILDLGLLGLSFFLLIFYFIVKKLIIFKNISNLPKFEKLCIMTFAIHFLSIFWPLSTHGSIFSSWNSTFYLMNFCLFFSLSSFYIKKNNANN